VAEKILLIQPRWMTQAMAQQQIEFWREKFPRAQLTLLAATPLEQAGKGNITQWALPPLQKGAMLRFARHLRRTRFRYAVVLSDNARGDVGYGEAKFWAFVANARWREFDGSSLTWRREAKAKRKVALILTVHGIEALCGLLKVPVRPDSTVSPVLLNNARTFVYLQHAVHQHGVTPGLVLFIGERWDEDTARRCGWQVAQENSEIHLALIDGWRENEISGRANCLCCFCGVTHSVSLPEGAREIENREAFFDNGAQDIWLVTKQ
jgi:hypothetical protein